MKKGLLIISLLMFAMFGVLTACKIDSGDGDSETETEETAASEDDTGSEDTETEVSESSAVSEFLSSAPVLRMDIEENAIEASASRYRSYDAGATWNQAAQTSNPAVGGCMAWSVRKNAINAAAVIQELSCAFNYLAANHADYFSEGVNYFKIPEFRDGKDLKAKVTLEGETATVKICMPQMSGEIPDQSNAEIVADQVTEGQYQVKGTWITQYPVNENTGVAPTRYFEEIMDATGDSEERFSYFDYWKNETDADVCRGTSGTSDATDDTCFISLSGSFYNNKSESDPYSTMTGNFSEKNSGGARTAAAVYAHFKEAMGRSKYSAGHDGVNADVNTDTHTDTWSPKDFEDASGDAAIVADKTLPDRRTTLPVIDDAWNCQAEGEFVEIPAEYAQVVINQCRVGNMNDADITSCTDETEITDAISAFLNDPCDPLLSDLSNCTIER